MHTARTLRLRRETLSELTTDELHGIEAGAMSGYGCPTSGQTCLCPSYGYTCTCYLTLRYCDSALECVEISGTLCP